MTEYDPTGTAIIWQKPAGGTPKAESNGTGDLHEDHTLAPPQVKKLKSLLVEADNLICVLENLTRGFAKHIPEDKDCWCNGCVNPRAQDWMTAFRKLRSGGG